MNTRLTTFAAAATLLAMFAACATPPKVMVSQYFHDDKDIEYLMQKADKQTEQAALQAATQVAAQALAARLQTELVSFKKKSDLFHFFIRVCDYDQYGKRNNCNETLVVPYVYPESVYH